jgi:hypothetical protein
LRWNKSLPRDATGIPLKVFRVSKIRNYAKGGHKMGCISTEGTLITLKSYLRWFTEEMVLKVNSVFNGMNARLKLNAQNFSIGKKVA